jgi:ABC-type multidrug transport system fused ATPase/permease subunit
MLGVVSADPDDSAGLAMRLARMVADDEVRLGRVRLAELPLGSVRRRVLLSEAEPRLFTGRLRDELDPWGTASGDAALLDAVDVAAAGDVLEALPEGLQAEVDEAGRGFSGGQRQRLALARALVADSEVLVLVEPTSAVDAHTEAQIADRLRAARRGRTTVVTTASPLLLDRCDEVALLVAGRVVVTGTHRELLASHPGYRETVTRGDDA